MNNNYLEEIGIIPERSHKLAWTYILGFLFSIILTLIAYGMATTHALSRAPLLITLLILALVQFVVQLVCFLHLSTAQSSRERLIAMGAATIVVIILVSGSLWIMLTLNSRMMPSTQAMEQYMQDQVGF